MFDGVPDQFHQFMASSRTSLHHHQIPFNYSLHGASPTPTFPTFDPYPNPHQTLQPHLSLHQLHHHHQHPPPPTTTTTLKQEQLEEETTLDLALEKERMELELESNNTPWSQDEVLALLKIRSSMENWLDFSWEHVSRKLLELGYKRSGEKCKEKFEEESRNLNNNMSYKNYRFFTELDELYHGENSQVSADQKNQQEDQHEIEEEDEEHQMDNTTHEDGPRNPEADINATDDNDNNTFVCDEKREEEMVEMKRNVGKSKKRKREKHHFEMFKGLCEGVVMKLMAQQEELHKKLIQEMENREREKVAREEAWRNQEVERINKEIGIRAKERAMSSERQAAIIEFLKKYASDQSPNRHIHHQDLGKIDGADHATNVVPTSSSEIISPLNPSSPIPSQNPSDLLKTKETLNGVSSKRSDSTDPGKRWPRDEVLALINLRCNILTSNNSETQERELGAKGPLWERISQGMLELGYKRSAKRCKEKWENINKYFRKTKDNNKKRSVDSRTCPYFHQLDVLYSQGKLIASTDLLAENS